MITNIRKYNKQKQISNFEITAVSMNRVKFKG